MAFPGLMAVSAVRWIVGALELLHGLHLVWVIREHLQNCRDLLHLTSFQMPVVTWPCCLPTKFSRTVSSLWNSPTHRRRGVQLHFLCNYYDKKDKENTAGYSFQTSAFNQGKAVVSAVEVQYENDLEPVWYNGPGLRWEVLFRGIFLTSYWTNDTRLSVWFVGWQDLRNQHLIEYSQHYNEYLNLPTKERQPKGLECTGLKRKT